ncbi:MAG: hypothetical protein PHR28_04810 [candidate division Zixibacteria bacterium]|nr:hypothetical protein [candidate division Zixibacteria bacterium]
MRFKVFALGLTTILIVVVGIPAVANDGRIPPIIDPSLSEHPWGGDQVNPGGDGQGPLLGGDHPILGNFNFFSRLALSYAWTTVKQQLLTSTRDNTTVLSPAPNGTSVRRSTVKPYTRQARNR